MILTEIQKSLETLYDLGIPYAVGDFLLPRIGEGSLAIGSPTRKEMLILKEVGNSLELGLYVDPTTVCLLEKYNPFGHIDARNFGALCIATEGVSHFLYVVDRAIKSVSVTQLELEIQAEVDKFLLTGFLYKKNDREVPSDLFSRIFERFSLPPALSPLQRQRYQAANRLAARFCQDLNSNYIRRGRWQEVTERARLFYRKNHWQKLRFLDA